MAGKIKDIINKAKKIKTSDYLDEEMESKKGIGDYFSDFQGFVRSVVSSIKTSFEKTKEKKQKFNTKNDDNDINIDEISQTADDKHNKIFGKIVKLLLIGLLLSLVLVLIVAAYKVFFTTKEIRKKETRLNPEQIIPKDGLSFAADQFSWKDKVRSRLDEQKEAIVKIEKKLDHQQKSTEVQFDNLSKSIKKMSKDIKQTLHQEVVSLDRKYDAVITQQKQDIQQYIDKKLSQIPQNTQIPVQQKSVIKSLIPIPSKSSGNSSLSSQSASKESAPVKLETKQEADKKREEEIREREEKIMLSVDLENIATDSSGFDEIGTPDNDTNKTLPPIVLRQGFTNGVLITGVSAPTFNTTSSDNQAAVVFMTFKGDSIISNYFNQNIENCTATGSVFGNIVTRRAEILVNKISCTFKKNGKVYMIRKNVKGWVFDGYDGKLGIPGILVDHSGSILNDSALIGLLEGFGNFVSSSASIYAQQGMYGTNISGQPTFNPGQVAGTNIVGGFGKQLSEGFNIITQYYKRIVDALFPFIDIKGGRKITILFDGGEEIKPKVYRALDVEDMDMGDGGSSDMDDDEYTVEIDNENW